MDSPARERRLPNRSPHASPTPSDRQRAIYDDEEWDDGDAHTVAHGLEYWAAPMDAIGAVLKEVLAQQRRIASIHAEWESTDAEKLPAEVDAATQRLADLKAMAVEAQQVLSELKDSRREWPRMAAWTLVLLAVPMLAFALMETSARHAPTCGGHCQSISFLQDCQAVSPMTSFVFLTTLLWLCAFIVRHKVLPAYWPRMNSAMAASLRERSVASFMKAFVRFCVLVHLLYLVQYWSISLGLRMGGAATPLTNHTDYCAGEHGTARRLWHSAKGNFVSVMVWEITLLPSLRWDTWLHHLFLILGVTFATDHNLRQAYTYGSSAASVDAAGPSSTGETLDGFAFVLMFGASCMAFKEFIVLLFQHRKRLYDGKQYTDLLAACIVHATVQVVFYLGLPAVYIIVSVANGSMAGLVGVLLSTLVIIINVLSLYIFGLTFGVMLHKRSAARATQKRRGDLRTGRQNIQDAPDRLSAQPLLGTL